MYRMTDYAHSRYDRRGNDRDSLIREASKQVGCFVLWAWNGKQWTQEESFLFTGGN